MGDLISRQAAIAHAISGRTREIEGEKWIRVSEVRESLQTMPSAERLEVQSSECEYWDDESNFCTLYRPSAERHGRWIENEFGAYCSECGLYAYRSNGIPWKSNYCPICGASIMDDNAIQHTKCVGNALDEVEE